MIFLLVRTPTVYVHAGGEATPHNGVELNFALSLADLRKRKPGELALTGPKTSN
jgi:hypothetical protein